MNPMRILALLLTAAVPSYARVVTAPVRLPGAPVLAPAVLPLAAPSLTAPLAPAVPVLPRFVGAASLPSAPGVRAVPAAAVLAAPAAAAAPILPPEAAKGIPTEFSPFGASLSEFAARLTDASKGGSALPASAQAGALFDGARAAGAPAVSASALPRGFARGELTARDGARLSFGLRRPAAEAGPARVFVGGMSLPDSFLTYFQSAPSSQADYVLSLRGLPPSAFAPTKEVYDADALDMARMVVTAAQNSPGGRVELALHSYGTLVFQRMLQMRGDAEVDRALAALRGQRVVMFAPTTHFGDSETVAGPEYAEMAKRVKMFVSWLDAGDAYLANWRAMARLNPALIPSVEALAMSWSAQKAAALSMAAKPAADLLQSHLADPWAPELEATRRALVAETRRAATDPGWQEALMRRANDTSKLDFTPADAAALRASGIRLDLVLSRGDQLLPWASQRLMPSLFGIDLPASATEAGGAYADETGRVRVLIADGDHYLPLKNPAAVERVLAR